MTGYLLRRVGQAMIVVLGVTFLVFILSRVIPGGEARAALGPRALPQAIAQFNRVNGFNLPLWDQFYQYLRNLLESFNLGYSYHYNQSVKALISERLPKTLVLVGIATVFALIVAIPLGVLQVVRRNKPVDYVLTGLSFIGYSAPAFLLGTLLILYFAIDLRWFSVEAPQGATVGAILADPPRSRASRPHTVGAHHRRVQPLHALLDDGGDDPGLHPHGARRARGPGGSCSGTRCATRSSRLSR